MVNDQSGLVKLQIKQKQFNFYVESDKTKSNKNIWNTNVKCQVGLPLRQFSDLNT